jgi:hypothetical protein
MGDVAGVALRRSAVCGGAVGGVMTPLSGYLIQALHVRDLLERGRYAEARLVQFRLVCELRKAVLNENAPGSDPQG